MDQFRAPERRLFRKTRSPFAAVALAATLGFAGILAGPVASASAATTYPVATTVPVGVNPTGVAVNANTNTAYVTNILEGTVSVIDGTTKTVTTTVPVGNEPAEVAVNANTNTVYVVNQADNTVAVIDEATNTVTDTVPVGSGASGVAVNASTNTAYVTNFNGGTISVITPVTVPGVPTSISAIAGDGQASVAFTAPSDRGHSAITEYMVTATNTTTPGDGGQTASGSDSPIVVTGLTNGDSYTFTVTATNAIGTGPASADSNPVTPTAPPTTPTPIPSSPPAPVTPTPETLGTTPAGSSLAATGVNPALPLGLAGLLLMVGLAALGATRSRCRSGNPYTG